jgi:hypothetical protein
MAQLRTHTLNTDAQTFIMTVGGNERAMVTMTIANTITVTWTVAAPGGANFVPLKKQDGTTNAAYTATDYLMVDGPATLKATASGVSGGGTCAIEARDQFVE